MSVSICLSIASCKRSSQLRTPHASSPQQSIATTLHPSCINCTGFLSINEWHSNSRVWCTSQYLVTHRCTWQMTFTCCQKVTIASFVPQAPEHAFLRELTTAMLAEFSATGPRLWNSLPSHLRLSDIGYNDFRRQLKTFLFGQTAVQCIVTLVLCAL